jgi:hypothetical protein
LQRFAEEFPSVADLIETNPPLATCLANASTWDTLRCGSATVAYLIRWRRRKICGALGFPPNESVVRILSKVAPEACEIALLMRMRRHLNNLVLLRILSHVREIGKTELRLVANWKSCTYMSVPLFLELAAMEQQDFWRLIEDTERMMEQSGRVFPPLRSVEDLDRRHLALISEQNSKEAAVVTFPPPPIPGTPTIQPLVNPQELLKEGLVQNNCVSSYSMEVAKGITYIYRVLSPERATASIIPSDEGWCLCEIAGPGNSEISEATRAEVEEWLLAAQFPHPPLAGGPSIEPLVTLSDLLVELEKMNNFSPHYAWDIAKGWHYFFRILEPERATIMISRSDLWRVRQILGEGNSQVSAKTWAAAERWLRDAQSRAGAEEFPGVTQG